MSNNCQFLFSCSYRTFLNRRSGCSHRW